MPIVNRRKFLKTSGALTLPAVLPFTANASGTKKEKSAELEKIIKFYFDGEDFNPARYIEEWQRLNSIGPIQRDSYGSGGVVEAMEKKFAAITGKEAAIFMPTGTMSNQLAIAILSGEKTKIFVQDTSHVYRDEADAAQSVFQKRLMPLAAGETYFTAAQLKDAINGLGAQEVFSSGIGAVSIENPVRRTNGQMVPIEEIRKISEYCRANNIKMHLDGARIHIASAWSGVSISEYASLFDTVYISLYKYLGAPSGAVLCGDKTVIEKIPHLMKVHGGTIFSAWPSASIVNARLDTIDGTLANVRKQATELFSALNQIPGFSITAAPGATNMYDFQLAVNIDGRKMRDVLNKEFNIRMPPFNDKNKTNLTVNETLLYKDVPYIINAFNKSMKG